MRLILVCHGDGHGAVDAPPSDLALRRARAIATELRTDHARRQPVGGVYAGPQLPSLETADLIAAELGLPQPVRATAFGGDGAAGLPALRALQSEAWSAIERFLEEHKAEEQVIAVTHALTIYAVVCRVLAMPLEDHQRFRIDPGSLTAVDFRPQRTILHSLNETCHLAGLETG